MRIIAGSARRTQLVAPQGQNTRPTSDMARESLFNIIAPHVPGAHFLDIFCGSGAMGIEALSRGAKTATFIDNAHSAIQAVQTNLAKTKLATQATVLKASATQALSGLNTAFDIIFLDPPYDTNLANQTIALLSGTSLLAPQGILIVESPQELIVPAPFTLTSQRKYGRAHFHFINLEGAV